MIHSKGESFHKLGRALRVISLVGILFGLNLSFIQLDLLDQSSFFYTAIISAFSISFFKDNVVLKIVNVIEIPSLLLGLGYIFINNVISGWLSNPTFSLYFLSIYFFCYVYKLFFRGTHQLQASNIFLGVGILGIVFTWGVLDYRAVGFVAALNGLILMQQIFFSQKMRHSLMLVTLSLLVILNLSYILTWGVESEIWTLIFIWITGLLFVPTSNHNRKKNKLAITWKTEVFVLVAILTLFTGLKLPYFGVSFTGEHTMKYSTHVEPALYMHERNDFLHVQKKYLSDPISNPTGEFSNFGIFPIHEWGIASLLYVFPDQKIEIPVRIWTHIVGIAIILTFYQFLKRFIPKQEALVSTALVSVSPIILFLSFVTVVDSILLVATFLALIYQDKFLKKGKLRNLLYSGLIIGIGVVSKISIYLWVAPMLLVIGLLSGQKYINKLKSVLLPLGVSFITFFIYRKSLINLPTSPFESISLFIALMAVGVGIFYLYVSREKVVDNYLERVLQNKSILLILTIMSFVLGTVILQYFGLARLSGEFLTDQYLIFNTALYRYMAWYQFRPFVGNIIFSLAIIGGIFIVFSSSLRTKWKTIVTSTLAGSLFYWVLASKSMYIHNYYTGIIVIFLTLLASVVVSFILNKTLRNSLTVLVIPLIVVPMFFINTSMIDQLLGKETEYIGEFMALSDFLAETMDQDELFIDDSYMLSAGIYSRRIRMASGKLSQDQIVADIEELGFANAMEKYNIKYLVTRYSPFRAQNYARLFVNEPFEPSTGYGRSERIRIDLGQSVQERGIQTPIQLPTEEYVRSKFQLVKQFGPYAVYSFKN